MFHAASDLAVLKTAKKRCGSRNLHFTETCVELFLGLVKPQSVPSVPPIPASGNRTLDFWEAFPMPSGRAAVARLDLRWLSPAISKACPTLLTVT